MVVKKKNKDISDNTLAKQMSWKKDWRKNKTLYFLFIPLAIYLFVFSYIPMTGILMAFENYKVKLGWFHSPWVGMDNFVKLFSGSTFLLAFRNTAAMQS